MPIVISCDIIVHTVSQYMTFFHSAFILTSGLRRRSTNMYFSNAFHWHQRIRYISLSSVGAIIPVATSRSGFRADGLCVVMEGGVRPAIHVVVFDNHWRHPIHVLRATRCHNLERSPRIVVVTGATKQDLLLSVEVDIFEYKRDLSWRIYDSVLLLNFILAIHYYCNSRMEA